MYSHPLTLLRRQINPDYNLLKPTYWFGQVDSRPISLFRIFFGALLLKNALYSIALAHLFYSDEGIVPRAQFWEDPTRLTRGGFSLLQYLPDAWMTALFFAGWAAVSLCLLLGYQTRLMAVLNFLCKLSVLHRNPFPLSGADHVMTVLSFWMIFLPLDQHYSIASWPGQRRRSVATVSMPKTAYAFPLRITQIQIALVYLFTSIMKWQGTLWREGDALYYTFQQNGYLLSTGVWLGEVSPLWLLRLLTWSTLLIEISFAFLVFSPVFQPWARAVGLLLTAILHLGIAITMSIPDFSVVMWISYILFFDPSWVIWLENQFRRLFRRPPVTLALPPYPTGTSLTAQNGLWPHRTRILSRALLTLSLTVILAATVWGGIEQASRSQMRAALPMPAPLKVIDRQLHLASSWRMFVYPVIPRAGWVMVDGQFENGETLLLYSGADLATGQMYRMWGPGARLRLLEQHLLSAFPSTILRAWGGYYCRLYNREQNLPAGQRLSSLMIHLHYRWSHAPGAPPNPYKDDLLWRHQCLSR